MVLCPSSTTPSTGGSAASLDSYIEGSRLFYVTVASHFDHFISLWRSNCSLVVDNQLQMMVFAVHTAGAVVVGYPGMCTHGVPLMEATRLRIVLT